MHISMVIHVSFVEFLRIRIILALNDRATQSLTCLFSWVWTNLTRERGWRTLLGLDLYHCKKNLQSNQIAAFEVVYITTSTV